MKQKSLFPLLIAGAALLIAGCGKSAEFKKLESDLFASLSTMHDDGMALMNKGRDLSSKIDDAIAARTIRWRRNIRSNSRGNPATI